MSIGFVCWIMVNKFADFLRYSEWKIFAQILIKFYLVQHIELNFKFALNSNFHFIKGNLFQIATKIHLIMKVLGAIELIFNL